MYALLPGSHTAEIPTPQSLFSLALGSHHGTHKLAVADANTEDEEEEEGDLLLRSCCLTLARCGLYGPACILVDRSITLFARAGHSSVWVICSFMPRRSSTPSSKRISRMVSH